MVEIRNRYRVPFDPSRIDQVFAIDIDALAYNERFEQIPIRFRVKVIWEDFAADDGPDRSDRCNWSAEVKTAGLTYHFDCSDWERDYAWMCLSHFSLDDCILSLDDDGVDYLNNFYMCLEILLSNSEEEGSYFDVGYILYQKMPLCRTIGT